MRWQRGVPLPPRLSQQNLRAVQLQIRYIGKLLPQGLKTWLKSFFFFKVCCSAPFRNISCPQWKAPQNINNHKKSLLTEAELGKKNQKTKTGKCVLFKWLLHTSSGVTGCCSLVTKLCPTLRSQGLPGSSVLGILQARILERVAIFLLQGNLPPTD